MRQALLIGVGFVLMESFSYFFHRWMLHGFLWKIHRSHHLPRKKAIFELNDIFSLTFSIIAFAMVMAPSPNISSLGIGVTIYGILYFIIHGLFTHRRFFPFNSRNRILLMFRSAHQRHHQSVEKSGLEPFGLFFFNYSKFWNRLRL